MSQTFKITLMGDAAVGKSAILQRMVDKKFSDMYISTLGCDFKTLEIDYIKLEIWDTSGQQRFKDIALSYCKGTNAIVFVYDVTHKESFDHLDTLIPEVQKQCSPNTRYYLVGNKVDRSDKMVSNDDVGSLVAKYNLCAPFNVFAKTGNGVESFFITLVDHMYKYCKKSTPVDEKDMAFEEINAELSSICEKLTNITQRLKSLKDKN